MSSALLESPLVGEQRPRVLSLPPALAELENDFGDRAVKLAELAGLHLDPWQQFALRSMLRRTQMGHWAAFESCLLVPRQNGKSVVLEAFDLAKLFLSPPGHLILHTAHLFPTAMESFRHLTGLIKNTPELWAEVARIPNAHGQEGVELINGSRLRFAARTVTGAGRGFSPDDVVLDEAFKLPHEALSAMMPALSAKPDPQLVYASSTGYPDSEILWTLVERGRTGDDPSLAFLEWSADPDLDFDDDGQLWRGVAQSNPALGFRLTERKIAAEMAGMRSEDRDRERLGLWADVARNGIFPAGVWESRKDVESEIVGAVTFAVEVADDRSWSAFAAAGSGTVGTHGEVVAYLPGTDRIIARIVEVTSRHSVANVVIRPSSQAGSLISDLETAGVTVLKASTQDYAQACGMIYDDVIAENAFRHLGQGELDLAVGGTLKRAAGDSSVWDQRKSSLDISPWSAVTLAVWGHKVHGAVDVSEQIW